MLGNANSLYDLVGDRSYDKKIAGPLFVLQDEKWRKFYAILKANILFLYESELRLESPTLLILVEDCLVEPSDDNQTGKPFSFSIKFKTTGRIFEMAAVDFESLGNWISFLTISSMDYMLATKQSLQQQTSSTTQTAEDGVCGDL